MIMNMENFFWSLLIRPQHILHVRAGYMYMTHHHGHNIFGWSITDSIYVHEELVKLSVRSTCTVYKLWRSLFRAKNSLYRDRRRKACHLFVETCTVSSPRYLTKFMLKRES